MTTTNPEQAKYRLTNEPALPSKCSGCGVDAKGYNYFVDFDLSLDYYGAVLFCLDCCSQIVSLLPVEDNEELIEAIRTAQDLQEENFTLREQVKALEDVLRAFKFSDVPVDEPSVPSNPFSVFEDPEDVISDSDGSDTKTVSKFDEPPRKRAGSSAKSAD